ncbi:hypothetical protein CLV24_1102 [Pontibacter ummariensis]|uniref:Uncharacterized protein n=1 Tax=Pontibacter ummariensis TaxID=1610492 RepID=A0A239GAY5_9BACT|nr:polysialyltransferase family glycosyltransferase [Pontibacter ummariensis]PRY11557.1 hypothetical protein CLV24_1102 [Pontibacter ummariensis]SNS66260.1 hypothetical protein SAMN06296052_110146 [Pontibacter ummariensis]
MGEAPNILFIGNYSRLDYLSLLKDSRGHCRFTFLFYASPKEEKNTTYKKYGEAIYWQDFTSADQLLSAVTPSKVVFLYIESYNHVLLNLACQKATIPTYLLEHGLRAAVSFQYKNKPQLKTSIKTKLDLYLTILRDLRSRIRTRRFLLNSLKELSANDKAFAEQFIRVRSKHNYLDTVREVSSPKRLAGHYVSFSPKIFKIHQEQEALPNKQARSFIGIPYFDKFCNVTRAKHLQRAILLIDQPLAEQGLLQWDRANKQVFIQELLKVCSEHRYKLYVKPHPWQDLKLWEEQRSTTNLEIVDEEKLLALAPSIPLVLGFYSTLLMPFAAFRHTTVITYENHPAGKLLISQPFIESGVAHAICSLKELGGILPNLEKLHQQQFPHKATFINDWLYKFDGKSGERLRDILLSGEL